MKNQILLENYYLPGQLERRLAEFVDYYNMQRYHESLNNLTRRGLLRPWSIHPDPEGKHQAQKPSSYDAGCTTRLQLLLQLRWAKSPLKSVANLSKGSDDIQRAR